MCRNENNRCLEMFGCLHQDQFLSVGGGGERERMGVTSCRHLKEKRCRLRTMCTRRNTEVVKCFLGSLSSYVWDAPAQCMPLPPSPLPPPPSLNPGCHFKTTRALCLINSMYGDALPEKARYRRRAAQPPGREGGHRLLEESSGLA